MAEGANARGRATLLRESRKVASSAAYAVRSFLFLFLSSYFLFFFSPATRPWLRSIAFFLVLAPRLLRSFPDQLRRGTIPMSRLSLFLPFYPARLGPLDRLGSRRPLSFSVRGNARLSHTHVVTVDYCAFRNDPTGKRAPQSRRRSREATWER